MKNVTGILALIFALTGCGKSGSNSESKVSGAPISPSIPSSPSSSPIWPLADAITTVSLGSFSCANLSAGGIKCYDGTSIYTLPGLGATPIDRVVVGATIACAITEPHGTAVDCANLSDPSCTKPAINNAVYCWNLSDFNTISIDEATFFGFASPYFSGPADIYLSSGDVCIKQSSYRWDGLFMQNDNACGSTVDSMGFIQ